MNTDSRSVQVFKMEFPDLASQFELKEFQKNVIDYIIESPSVLAVMPTGGGKSLIYWTAARAIKGTCLVISPLIALIDEQAEKLSEQGFSVLAIHSGTSASEQIKQLKSFARGELKPDFIFASPERLATDGFFEYCLSVQMDAVKLLVIDEVHCISQWGFDFRPFYKHIPDFLNKVFKDEWPKILGLTATINPKELNDITSDFNIPAEAIHKDEILLRKDVNMKVEKFALENEKTERLWQLLEQYRDEKILVYQYRKYRKRGVEDLSDTANQKGFSALAFHGDMTGQKRQEILAQFKSGETKVIFATNAFGMGIDIPDIRIVIHFMIPESIEQYYQEIGRAGRDKNGATSYLLYSNKNISYRKDEFIEKSFPDKDKLIGLFKRATDNKAGYRSLQYFSEEKLQAALPYFLNTGAISIEGKGFTSLKIFKKVQDDDLDELLKISRTGMVIPMLKKKEIQDESSIRNFFGLFYSSLVNERAQLSKNFDKCLIIDAHVESLSDEMVSTIQQEIDEKKKYKYELLEYLVYLLDNYDDTEGLHQEIGRYLGVPKHTLGKIHLTESGDWVRSKSEVIIANILFRSGIPFVYEEKLYYSTDKWKEPDFTIHTNQGTWYWEHLGMLGLEEYNQSWMEKKQIYESLGIIERVITTVESSVLSNIVNKKVSDLQRIIGYEG